MRPYPSSHSNPALPNHAPPPPPLNIYQGQAQSCFGPSRKISNFVPGAEFEIRITRFHHIHDQTISSCIPRQKTLKFEKLAMLQLSYTFFYYCFIIIYCSKFSTSVKKTAHRSWKLVTKYTCLFPFTLLTPTY